MLTYTEMYSKWLLETNNTKPNQEFIGIFFKKIINYYYSLFLVGKFFKVVETL